MNPPQTLNNWNSILSVVFRPRSHSDVLVGGGLVQQDNLLLFQHQEGEESGCSLRSSASFTEQLQAERGVSDGLALLWTQTETYA